MFLDQTLTGSLCKFQITGKEVEWLRRSNALLGRPESETPSLERNTWTDEKQHYKTHSLFEQTTKTQSKTTKTPKKQNSFFLKKCETISRHNLEWTGFEGLPSKHRSSICSLHTPELNCVGFPSQHIHWIWLHLKVILLLALLHTRWPCDHMATHSVIDDAFAFEMLQSGLQGHWRSV
jgi:hypothetical protein